MTLSASTWQRVRERAGGACEYCGVSDSDTGGPLTVDHYRPRSSGGTDALNNLVYACHACNGSKGPYWPVSPNDPAIWNPRSERRSQHLTESEDCQLEGNTATGDWTIDRLRLNRPSLVSYRQRRRLRGSQSRLLAELAEVVDEIEHTYEQVIESSEKRAALLQTIRSLTEQLHNSMQE